mmetsp:Transcript_4384/g.11733  ORF Transcript_4384/g.11733 Transcript_4384/m.11733 type:complete len:130 (+) Transcript_4384:197-586(+)
MHRMVATRHKQRKIVPSSCHLPPYRIGELFATPLSRSLTPSLSRPLPLLPLIRTAPPMHPSQPHHTACAASQRAKRVLLRPPRRVRRCLQRPVLRASRACSTWCSSVEAGDHGWRSSSSKYAALAAGKS